MRFRNAASVAVIFSILASTASADFFATGYHRQSLRQTAGLAVGKLCAEAWAARDGRTLDDIDRSTNLALSEARRLADAAEQSVAELERKVHGAEGRRVELQTQLAGLTGGRDTERGRLEAKRAAIGVAAAAFDGLAKRRRSIEAQLADPNAPVKDGFDSRRLVFGGSLGGRDAANFSPRLAELQAQLDAVKAEMRGFAAIHPVIDPAPAPDETSIRAAIAREIVDIDRDLEAYWRNRDRDPGRISNLQDKERALSTDLDELRLTLGIAREHARVARAFAAGLERVVDAVKVCTNDQRAWLAGRRGNATGTPGPVGPPAPVEGLRGALELNCGSERRRGTITFRSDAIPPPGSNSGYTARLTWAVEGGPHGSLDNMKGLISPEGPRSWSTVGNSQTSSGSHMFLAVMETGGDPRLVERVRGILCGQIPGATGNCQGRFWTPANAPMPPFEEELSCPAAP